MQHDNTPPYAILEGMISVHAVLQSGSRDIDAIFLRVGPSDPARRHLESLARARQVPVVTVSTEEIDAQASGKSHGGVLAHVGPRKFAALPDLLPSAESQRAAFIAMIDGVEDPFNFGQAVRCLYASGADGLVVRPRNWLSAAGVVARASAGASELLPTAVAETAQEAVDFYQSQGLAVIVADDDPRLSVPLHQADLTCPLFLLVGGEKRGVTRAVLSRANCRVRIPYGRRVPQALGTASAAAILAFEVLRQRS